MTITRSIFIVVVTAGAMMSIATPARAGTATAPCGPGFAAPLRLGPLANGNPDQAWMALPVVHLWGLDNAGVVQEDGRAILQVRYPEGSINPGRRDAPRGGLGFFLPVPGAHDAREICLSYEVRFPDGFAFARGGKLPGLYGGDAPRGGATDRMEGFSARLMWREAGAGELYLYAPDQAQPYGQSLGRAHFYFRPGHWTQVVEHLRPGVDGHLRLLIDGAEVTSFLGRLPVGSAAGLMMSTFFGGSSPDWASPRDQSASFADITIWLRP